MNKPENPLGLARQPIFDQDLNVVAYELLYQPSEGANIAKFLQGDQESCNALVRNFTSIYDSGSFRTLPAFLNITEEFIRTDSLPNLSQHNLVIEINNSTSPAPPVEARLTEYIKAGYRIALDDFDYDDRFASVLEIANIVRVDIGKRSREELAEHIKHIRPYKVTLLAEHVSSQTEYEQCVSLGFKLFQGSFLSHPTLVEGKKLSSNQTIVIHLLAALQDKEVTPETLAAIASRDPHLTFKLLRIVNSARFNLPNEIKSLSQAIIALGMDEINKWATLLALASNDQKPSELIRQILITARMCEYVAYHTRETDSDLAFICGMLSILDALLEIPQKQLLEQLTLSEEVVEAITQYKGPAGKLLQAVNFYMIGQSAFKVPADVLQIYNEAYYESLRWSNEAMQMMQSSSE